jgi:hypothetical protein
MAMLVTEDPTITSVLDTYAYANKKDVTFSFYILWMCAHAYVMRQRRVLDDNEWAGWLHFMRNCFLRGTIREIWKQVEPEGFLNTEIIGVKPQ